MNTDIEYNIDCFNKGCEQNYFKIYKYLAFNVMVTEVRLLRVCPVGNGTASWPQALKV